MFDDVVRSLDARRLELGLTKADVAARANMPSAAVRRLFSQQQKNPTLVTLVAIADALDLHISVMPRKEVSERSTAPVPRHRSVSGSVTEAPSRTSETRRRTA
ncbi:MAG: helix-turn-helix domain-containing protein [Acidimicrobiales bacterium]